MTPAADDDKTAFTPRGEAPRAGGEPTNFAPTAAAQHTAINLPPTAKAPDLGNGLPIGTRIGEFELTSLLGEGGFGIVYLATDHSLGRRVALKEYMPSSLAMRTADSGVQVKSDRYRETFEAGRKSFVNEARLLAQFDHPSLVKVYRFWESNGTAYMVMPFYEGKNLKDTLREMKAATGQPPSETWLRTLLLPLSEALRVIHVEQCYHRDIAPDNVMMLAGSGRPLLLDFGAARRVIGDMTQALTVILKPGYAPIEQYAEIPGMRQGTWTDIYALAAVVYYAITGKTPPVSVGRMVNDNYQPLAQVAAEHYSAQFLEAVDRALAVRPENRTQTIEAFREDLGLVEPGTIAGGVTLVRPAPLEPTRIAPGGSVRPGGGVTDMPAHRQQALTEQPEPQAAPLPSRVAPGRAAPPPAEAAYEATMRAPRMPAERAAVAARPVVAPRETEPSGSRRGLVIGGIGATAAAVGIGGFLLSQRGAPTGSGATLAPTRSPTTTPTPPPTVPLTPPPVNFEAVREFDKAVLAQAAGFGVSAKAPKSTLRVGADEVRFTAQSERGGHLYVLAVDPDGVLVQLVPNRRSGPVRLRAGQAWQFPTKDGFALDVVEPLGANHLLVMVSTEARSFAAMKPKTEGDIQIFAAGADATSAVAAHTGSGSVVAGRAVCPDGGNTCDASYGAAVLKLNVVR